MITMGLHNFVMEFVFLAGPFVATIVGALLILFGLQEARKHSWLFVVAGITILALICYLFFNIATLGDIAPLGALILGFFCACIAVVIGLWMLWTLKAWRKSAALIVIILFPISMFYSVQMGDAQSPESLTRQNGHLIVEALYQYQTMFGGFPENLTDLEPEFLATQPPALTTQGTGWMYASTGDQFALGYWYWPEKYGSWVCLYVATNPQWDCEPNNWGAFDVIPTPGGPCKDENGQWVYGEDCK